MQKCQRRACACLAWNDCRGDADQTTSALCLFIHLRARCWLCFIAQVCSANADCSGQPSPAGAPLWSGPLGPESDGTNPRLRESLRQLLVLHLLSADSASAEGFSWKQMLSVVLRSCSQPRPAPNKVVFLQFTQHAGSQQRFHAGTT